MEGTDGGGEGACAVELPLGSRGMSLQYISSRMLESPTMAPGWLGKCRAARSKSVRASCLSPWATSNSPRYAPVNQKLQYEIGTLLTAAKTSPHSSSTLFPPPQPLSAKALLVEDS